jgi:hypothetical protein
VPSLRRQAVYRQGEYVCYDCPLPTPVSPCHTTPHLTSHTHTYACVYVHTTQIFGRSENARDLRGPAQTLNAKHGEERDRRIQGRELLEEQEQEGAMGGREMGQQAAAFFRGRQVYHEQDDYYEDGCGV